MVILADVTVSDRVFTMTGPRPSRKRSPGRSRPRTSCSCPLRSAPRNASGWAFWGAWRTRPACSNPSEIRPVSMPFSIACASSSPCVTTCCATPGRTMARRPTYRASGFYPTVAPRPCSPVSGSLRARTCQPASGRQRRCSRCSSSYCAICLLHERPCRSVCSVLAPRFASPSGSSMPCRTMLGNGKPSRPCRARCFVRNPLRRRARSSARSHRGHRGRAHAVWLGAALHRSAGTRHCRRCAWCRHLSPVPHSSRGRRCPRGAPAITRCWSARRRTS